MVFSSCSNTKWVQRVCPDITNGEITRGKLVVTHRNNFTACEVIKKVSVGRETIEEEAVIAETKSHLPLLLHLGKPAPLHRVPQPLLRHKSSTNRKQQSEPHPSGSKKRNSAKTGLQKTPTPPAPITQLPTKAAPSRPPGCSAAPSPPPHRSPGTGTKRPLCCWGLKLRPGTKCSKHIATPSKRQEPAHLCKYLLLLVKTLDRVTFLPLFISFICLETQTAKIIGGLTSSDFTGAAARSVAILQRLQWHSWRKQRCSCASCTRPHSSSGCRETNEARVDTSDLSQAME